MLTLDLKKQFLSLAGQLSPENLFCDGEISRAQAKKREKQIKAEWRKLEKLVGRPVGDSEPWSWIDEVDKARREERQRFMASQPQNPLVEHSNPGTWSRRGSNGSSAYYIHNSKHRGPFIYNGIDLNKDAEDVYTLFSEFSYTIARKEEIGKFDSLDAAVEAGETYLKGITRESLQQALPNYLPENIERLLKRLP